MVRSRTPLKVQANHETLQFGTLLKTLRHRHGIRQSQVLTHLQGWTQATYSRVENGLVAPVFDQLAPIYFALCLAGVKVTPQDRQQFLTLARIRIEGKKTYREYKTDQEWEELRLLLSRTEAGTQNHRHQAPHQDRTISRLRLVETRHLVGREDWVASLIASFNETLPKKLLVLQGPVGIGKSSELHRIALHFLHTDVSRRQVVLCELPFMERESGPESALDLFLGAVLVEVGPPDASLHMTSLAMRITFTLQCLEKAARPLLLLLDNAEQIMDEQGHLAACWEEFLRKFLRSQHRSCLVLATKEWPGWSEGERVFLTERMIPPLSTDAGVLLLQQLGLADVPPEHLRRVSETVGGIPLCLEWVVSLVLEPMLRDEWDDSDDLDDAEEESGGEHILTRRLLRLLEDSSLFGGPIASKLKPLLERIIEKRLSAEAYQVLCTLALTNIPLGKPALQLVCPRPRLLKELSTASLLISYPRRIQLLPMVASAMRPRISDEQRQILEEKLIEALNHWLNVGKMSIQEVGTIITELAMLYLKQHRLLDAAQLLTHYGWLSFNIGHGPRLARLAANTRGKSDWHTTYDGEIGELLLQHLLAPFLGKALDYKKRIEDYQRIQDAVLMEKVTLHPSTEVTIMHQVLLHAMNELRFDEAQATLEIYSTRLGSLRLSHSDWHTSLLEEHALLFARWSEYANKQGEVQKAKSLREQAIALYRQCIEFLSTVNEPSPLKNGLFKRCLARCLNNLGYHLNNDGQYEEALLMVERGIALKEQGYVYVGALAASYGEKSQILAALGRFQESLLFDEKALAEVQRCASAGDVLSQEEVWIYRVNRGRLYLRIGRINEAEQLLQEALPHIHPRRRIYQMFAKESLEEIAQWCQQATSPHHQLDWRWIEQFRELDAFDAYWWWAHAGPFTEEEQQQWNQLITPNIDDATKAQLGKLLAQSRERELAVAISERREPQLYYPAIDIEEIRRRIEALLQLDIEVSQGEPNAIVRRLYHEKIEEEIWFLRMIAATYEQDSERFWEFSQLVYPKPTSEEMDYALSHVKQVLQRGLECSEAVSVSQKLIQFLHEQLHLSFEPSYKEAGMTQQKKSTPSSESQRMVTAQTAKRFFEAALCKSGYEGWQVVIDPKASAPRVESGLRQLFLQDSKMSLERVKHYLAHELAGHIARSVAGEQSLLGLLAIGTKNYSPTEEGLALYHERQLEILQGKVPNDWNLWFGTLVTGLACGALTPPQTFLSLFTFLDSFFLLWRLLEHLDANIQIAQEKSRKSALSTCLRVYRGVPDLQKVGVCLSKDVVYLRGLWLIERAVAQDKDILDRLAVGKVAIEYLPDLHELGIVALSQPLRKLVLDPNLDAYILSFEESSTHIDGLA